MKKMEKRRLPAGLLWLAVLAVIFCGGCGREKEEQEETARMGRYTERELELPDTGYKGMFPLGDGGYAFYGEGKVVQTVAADGTYQKNLSMWRNGVEGMILSEAGGYAVSPDGGLVFGYLPKYALEEYETMEDEELFRYSFLYVDAKGNRRLLEVSGEGFEKNENLEYLAFSPDGVLYASDSSGGVFSVDTESGRLEFLFQADSQITEFGFLGKLLIGLDEGQAWLYDREAGKLLEKNKLLDEFVASHQAGRKPIILCAGTGEEENILYLGCRSGLYRYVWEGSVIEQIGDGQFLTFGNSFYTPQSMQYLGEGRFRVFFNQNRLVECYYDETLPAETESTLTIYSLEEDSRIRYAAQLFQKSHPQVLVKVETGMEGDNAVSREDALKNLNTRILAGEGPDLMVLDGMDIEQYGEKGVLKKLDQVLEPYVEQGILYENIVDGMRMTESDSIYGMPMTVALPVWSGEREFFGGEDSLEKLVEGVRQSRSRHPEGALTMVRSERDLLLQLTFVCMNGWTDEQGSLDQEALTSFFEAAKEIWDLNDQGMTEEDWEKILEVYRDREEDEVLRNYGVLGTEMGIENFWVKLGVVQDTEWFSVVWLMGKNINDEVSGPYVKPDAQEWDYGFYQGQGKKAFWAQSIVGICESAREPELAQEFFELLLSDEIMDKWWLNRGLPVSKAALAHALDVNNLEFSQYLGIDETAEDRAKIWPPREDQQRLQDLMAQAEVFYQPGSALEELVTEVGIEVLKGGCTPREGAGEVAKRMAIAMEE